MSEDSQMVGTAPSSDEYRATPSIGQVLSNARQTQGLNIADVARSLKLGVRQVEAMEADDYEKLPGMTFAKGFIRNYARLLQIDPEPMLATLQDGISQASAPAISSSNAGIEISSSVTKSWLWVSLAILLLVVGAPLLVYELLNSQPQQLQPGKGSTATVATPPVLPKLPKVVSPPAAVETQVALPPAASATENITAPQSEVSKQDVSNAAATAVESSSAVAGEGIIKMSFAGDAWVEIRDKSGKSIFSQLSPAGSEQAVKGSPPFSMVVGNAANVRMTYNGKPVDLTPFIKVNVAHLTLQ